MSWKCERCNHWAPNNLVHDCPMLSLEKLECQIIERDEEIARLRAALSLAYSEAELRTGQFAERVRKLEAALEKLRDGPGNKMENWKQTWAHEFAAKALDSDGGGK